MSQGVRRVLLIFFLIALSCSIFVVLWFAWKEKNSVTMVGSQSSVQLPKTTPAVTQQDAIVYVNNEFGFELKLPPNWKGYTAIVERFETENVTNISFELPYNPSWKLHSEPVAPGTPVRVLTLQVMDTGSWNSLCKESHCSDAANAGPECNVCTDFLASNDRISVSGFFTVSFPDDINPEMKKFNNSAADFFKGKITLR